MDQNAAASRQPVTKVLAGYSNAEYQAFFDNYDYQTMLSGGDLALFANTRMALMMHTAIVSPSKAYSPLPSEPIPAIGKIEAQTVLGKLTLDDFLKNPQSYIQAIVIAHKGKIVFERYPGMRPTDSHLWASTAKPVTGLLIEHLIDAGKLDQNMTYGEYVQDFCGTAWEHVKIIDLMNMASGLNIGENDVTRHDPNSIMARLYHSEFGSPDPITNKIETSRTIMKAAAKICEPGTQFDYSSVITQSLIILIEEVTGKRFSDVADEQIFSHMSLENDIQINLSCADSLELGHGFLSSRLRDLMHFGMLYTPSWKKISDKQVVSDAALHRIQKELPSHEAFMSGYDGPRFMANLGDYIISNNRQWDAVFPDGDMMKLGYMSQGLYVSPDKDLVIAYFSTNTDIGPNQAYMRPIVESGLFNK